MPDPKTEIVICSDGRKVTRLELPPGEYVIGREHDVDIRGEADLVSRRHARLRIASDHALVEDLGSSNGTFVDGKPVTGSTRIVPGQRVEVGSAILELRRIMAAGDPDVASGRLVWPEEALRSNITFAEFTADGKKLLLRLEGLTSSREVFLRDAETGKFLAKTEPPWLAGLAEAVAGRRVDERGELVPVPFQQIGLFRDRLSGGGNDPYARWAAWFFADRATRAVSPWRDTKLADEIERLRKERGDSANLAILRHRPDDSDNLASLAGTARGAMKQSQFELDAETVFVVSTEARLKEALAPKRAAKVPAYTTGAGPRGFPRRDAACTERQLDLTRHYTHLLDMQFVSDERTHFGVLPMGLTTLDGIAWDLRGLVHLFGDKTTRVFPVRIEGIPVAQRFTRLHALQAANGTKLPDGTRLGHYLLRYKDGTTRELPIVYGEDLRDFHVGGDAAEPKHAREAWHGKAGTWDARLFHRTYENPRPEAEVAALDFVSAKADAGPFVVALTVE